MEVTDGLYFNSLLYQGLSNRLRRILDHAHKLESLSALEGEALLKLESLWALEGTALKIGLRLALAAEASKMRW